VRNLPSLKSLRFDESPVEDLEITGVDSLEELLIYEAPMGGDFVVSLMPNLKKLVVANGWKVDELISKAPSLESLSLKGLDTVHRLNIVNNDKLSKVDLSSWNELRVIDMDASELCRLSCSGRIDPFLEMLGKAADICCCCCCKEAGRSVVDVRYSGSNADGNDFHALRRFLTQQQLLSRSWFRLTLEFDFIREHKVIWREPHEDLHIPTIEHVKIFWAFSGYDRTPFFNGLFWNFHP
ncbi:unnamed protein product, partial [Linum tenue]